MTRRYLPATEQDLGGWYDAGLVPRTDRFYVAPEESELGEYSALMDAADASAQLPGGDGRRRVLVVDAPDADGSDGESVPWRRVQALHVDVDPGARPGDELAWYATQEIGALLGRA